VNIKALSFRQPWATLVVEGRKTMDLRTWSTHYRGQLAIYASLEVEKDACKLHGVDVSTLTTGALIGVVELVDIVPLTKKSYDDNEEKHLAGRHFREGLYGWILTDPRPLEPPQVVKGRLNLFDVNVGSADVHQIPAEAHSSIAPTTESSADTFPSEFELRVAPIDNYQYRLAFVQSLAETVPDQLYLYRPPQTRTRVEVELGGDALRAIADQVIETLRQNGYKPTDLKASRREPFLLSEETGVRLGLVFLAVKPVSKTSRIDAISQGIRHMASEELYYWYSKCTGGPSPERAQKALRILLAGE
jgi:hypothetical protein